MPPAFLKCCQKLTSTSLSFHKARPSYQIETLVGVELALAMGDLPVVPDLKAWLFRAGASANLILSSAKIAGTSSLFLLTFVELYKINSNTVILVINLYAFLLGLYLHENVNSLKLTKLWKDESPDLLR